MEFEWDESKSERNRGQRGFGFDYAALIFQNPTLESIDARADYGELRIKALGAVDEDVLSVVYTLRGETIRIISARLANKRERELWQSFA